MTIVISRPNENGVSRVEIAGPTAQCSVALKLTNRDNFFGTIADVVREMASSAFDEAGW